jgi:hypothetical protein
MISLLASQSKNKNHSNPLQSTCKASAKLTEQGNLLEGSTFSRICIISLTHLLRLLKALKIH